MKSILNHEDPGYNDKVTNIIISKIINNEEEEDINKYLCQSFNISESNAVSRIKSAKKTIKHYKTADIEVCIKVHAKRYEILQSISRKAGFPNLLLRATKAYTILLNIMAGDLALALRGRVIETVNRSDVGISSETKSDASNAFIHFNDEDRVWLKDTLIRIRRDTNGS